MLFFFSEKELKRIRLSFEIKFQIDFRFHFYNTN